MTAASSSTIPTATATATPRHAQGLARRRSRSSCVWEVCEIFSSCVLLVGTVGVRFLEAFLSVACSCSSSSGSWSHHPLRVAALGVAGCCWLLLVAAGCCWLLLV